ncbi:MFS transporter [Actinomycetospora rhizophila]|uniref:MFS transporter n=1 Tax=Actinomycetospora rhizophila TaxID=1416876 RepID=A0ABV9ZME1_9PSEU
MSSPEPDPRRWHALAVCLIAGFMTLLDVSIVNVALPSMQRGIGASAAELSWVVSGYALTFGLVLVASGRLGDDRGRKKMFMISLALFTLTSVAAGLAPNATSLVVFRLLQGAAGGMLNPQVIGFIQQLFTGRERGRAFGLFGAAIGISTAIGPLLGGLLLEWGGQTDGWRWVFYVNVPIGVAALVLGARLLPRDTATATEKRPLDAIGAVLLGGAVVAVMVPLVLSERDPASAPWWLLAVAVVLLIVFVLWERRARRTHGHPLVNFALLRTRSYALGTSLGLLYFAGFTAIFFVVTLFLQNGRGYTPLEAGLALTPFALGSAVSSAIGGRLVSRLGKPLVVGGLVLVALGLIAVDVVLRLDPEQVGWAIAAPLLLAGVGSGFVIAPNQTLALEEVPPREGGTAAGVLQTGQRVGSAVGISAVGAVFFGQLTSTGGDWALAISRGLVGAVAFVVLALVLGLIDLLLGRRRRAPAGTPVAEAPATAVAEHGEGLRGHVTDGSGAAVDGATLTLVDPDGHEAATATADAGGAFRLTPPAAGRFQLVTRADGHRPAVAWVDVPGDAQAVRDVVLEAVARSSAG